LFLNEKNHARFKKVADESDNETIIDRVLNFLEQANQQERIAVKQKLESDPGFFSELKHDAYMKLLTDIKDKESADQDAEADIFADIEAELASF
jgi:hypothetical protein